MADKFIVRGLAGAKALRGTVAVAGAKNAALKGLAASILFDGPVEFKNLPAIEDVARMQELLPSVPALTKSIAERLRASVVLTGPALARHGEVAFPFPGGCVLGERPIDLFLHGYRAMGAQVREDGELFRISGALSGARIFFPFVSVTATETLMMAATLARGETVLENAAMEPEIPDLAYFLNECGARIEGAGTSTIRIAGTGGRPLSPRVPYETPPDRIEAGSFAVLAALAGDDVTIANCNPAHLGALLALLRSAGVSVEVGDDWVRIRQGSASPHKMVSARTHEYPGFPTDLQALWAVLMTQCAGEGTILETIFDGRFRYADDLVRMGADITVMNPHKILIKGPTPLTAKHLEGPDLRAGLAYILAAAVAEGTSTIGNAYVIDRGYERIEQRLAALGLDIKRERV